MLLTDFLIFDERREEVDEQAYGHRLGPGLEEATLVAWERQHPRYPLPRDLRALLRRIDGIHLWARADTGRAYTGIAPLREWVGAPTRMHGAAACAELPDDRYLTISYHQDGAAFVVLDCGSGDYFLMDAAGPDRTSRIGATVPELLSWLWKTRIPPA